MAMDDMCEKRTKSYLGVGKNDSLYLYIGHIDYCKCYVSVKRTADWPQGRIVGVSIRNILVIGQWVVRIRVVAIYGPVGTWRENIEEQNQKQFYQTSFGKKIQPN